MENDPWLHKGKKSQRPGPDGLEAWGVAVAAFFVNFIMAGINRASGILYVEFIDAFQTDRMQASLPFTIRSVSRNLLGPVVGIFGQKYGVRPVILFGGVIGTLSTVACFFVADIFWISVFWGCFSGLGGSMIMILSQAAISQHFRKNISTASGIGLSGGCFGSFVLPVIFESLIEEYTIQGTFLFIAGLIMHVIPASIIMKKPSWLKNQSQKEKEVLENENIIGFSTDIDAVNIISVNAKNEEKDTFLLERNDSICCEKCRHNGNNKCLFKSNIPVNMLNKIDTNLLWDRRELVIRLLTNDNTVKFPSPEVLQSEKVYEDSQITEVVEVFLQIAKDVYSNSLIINDPVNFNDPLLNNPTEKTFLEVRNTSNEKENSNLCLNQTIDFNLNPADSLRVLLQKVFERDKEDVFALFPLDSHRDLNKIFDVLQSTYILMESNKCNSHICNNCSKSQQVCKNESSVQCSVAERSNTFCSHIKTAMWLHAKPLFLLTCLCRCVHFITFMPILTTVVDFSRDKGLPAEYGKYAIGTLAMGDLFGRLFSGWLTDKKYLTLPRYMFIFMILQGLFTIAIALTNCTESLLIVLTVYGLIQGCTFIRYPVLISHYMGKHEQSIALGCLNFFPGVIGFSMPFYIGYFRDTVGSYNGIFYINGSIGAFIGCLWLAEPYLLKCSLRLPQQHIPV